MKKLIITDEKIMCAGELYQQFKSIRKNKSQQLYKSVFFAGDDTFLCDYLLSAVGTANIKYPIFDKTAYICDGDISEYRADFVTEVKMPVVNQNDPILSENGDKLIFFFADCNDLNNKSKTLQKLKNILSAVGKGKVVVSAILPEFESFSKVSAATSLAERELNFYLEKHCERTAGIEYYLEIESLCRNSVLTDKTDISVLRFANIFAPDVYSNKNIDIKAIVNESVENGTISITDEDNKDVFSVSYVRDACSDIFFAAFNGRKGHIYNIASTEVSLADIKEHIYYTYSDKFSLEKKLSSGAKHNYFCINTLKFDGLNKTSDFDLDVMLKHIVSHITDFEYDTTDNVSFYCGRIKQIQAVEVEMLKEIDRICVENDIKYFLAGGTLLGAVRSGGAIEWDDDFDIGMLRNDFEKFRKICGKELSSQFTYVTPYNGSGSHYIIEKVRLDGTYFSTKYSGENIFPDGVFIDVIVYDKTSNIKLLRNLHILILAVLYNCIILRWNPKPWRNKFHGIVKFIVPVLKLFPWGFYHRLFDFFAGIYKNKKNAKWLIDTVGKKLKDGPLPIDGLEDTVYVDFEGVKAPVPVDYTGYLTYAYGPNYMEKPNLSNRKCPHDFARIDLGKYIFDKTGETGFRNVDIRGELFESENEI